jgi:hypothetical protein
MKLSLFLVLALAGCAGADPTAESEEELSSHAYDCKLSHHSAVALSIRVSKTKTKVTAYDANEFAADIGTGSTFTLNPDYVARSASLAGRSEYVWDTSNTRFILEQSLRTGGTVGYLTIEGGHLSHARQDFTCRR